MSVVHDDCSASAGIKVKPSPAAAGEGFTLIPALALQSSWTTDMGIFVGKINEKQASRKIS